MASDTQLEDAMAAALHRLDLDEFERLAGEVETRHAARLRRISAPDALSGAAAWYAAQGIPVFPVEERGKVPLVRWRDAATTIGAQVAAWWRRWPQANIGMPTGLRWDVIDIDGPPGYQSYATVREAEHLPPIAGRALTPRGGMHVYIAPTGDGNGASLGPGLDYRGIGGYVVIPPSVGGNGRRYDWCDVPEVGP
ncbi:MAG TPA: bifunctional DNA primase/polymerase [Sporichthya sp.]|nr:bifunctional DNA primase/polymerase [Sporichthya sp.]